MKAFSKYVIFFRFNGHTLKFSILNAFNRHIILMNEHQNDVDFETMANRLASYVDQIQPVIQLTGALQEQIDKLKKENALIIQDNCRLTLLDEDLRKDLKEAFQDANKWRSLYEDIEQQLTAVERRNTEVSRKGEKLHVKYMESKEKYNALKERFNELLEDRNEMIRASEAAYDEVAACLQAVASHVARPSNWEDEAEASDWDITDPWEEEEEESSTVSSPNAEEESS